MSALSSNSGEWQTPSWLVEKCREALGGYITLDAASIDMNPVKADFWYTKCDDALKQAWRADARFGRLHQPTLFLNPPGNRSGKLIRAFWDRWNEESKLFHAAVWVDFNLDHLRFITQVPGDCLVIPRKRMAFVDPATGKEKKGAQIGGFIYLRGDYFLGYGDALFPEPEYLTMWGEP